MSSFYKETNSGPLINQKMLYIQEIDTIHAKPFAMPNYWQRLDDVL